MIELRERTKALARELNVDLASRAPARQGDSNGPPQPTLEHVRSIQALPADQREKLVQEMVEGLSRRLQESPRDEEGWLRLICSRIVLGEQQAHVMCWRISPSAVPSVLAPGLEPGNVGL